MANSDAHHTLTLGAYATRFWHPVKDEKEIAEAIRQGAFTPEERFRWSKPASAMREKLWHRRIRGMLAKGIKDPVEIKRRAGASLQRIRRIMEREVGRQYTT